MIKIVLKGFDHAIVDASAMLIKNAASRAGVEINGPIPLPSRIKRYIVLTSPHVDKDAREKFEKPVHTRLLLLRDGKFLESIHDSVILPSGVHVEIKSDSE